MKGPNLREHSVLLSIGSKRCLKIVIDHRQIVVGADGRILFERIVIGRILPAMEHVVAVEIDARSQFHRQHRSDVVRLHDRTAAIHRRHTAAELRAEERRVRDIGHCIAHECVRGLGAEIAGHAALEAERVGLRRRHFLGRESPGLVGITTFERRHLMFRKYRVVPARHGIERNVEPCLKSDALERRDVIAPLPRTREIVLVLELHADDRAAILPEQALHLFRDFSPVTRDIGQIGGIVAACRHRMHDPIGNAAEAGFRVHPRAGPDHHLQTKVAAQRHKPVQIAVARPDEMAFVFLMVIPENVGRDDADAGHLHLLQFLLPVAVGKAREMKFAHHRQPRLSVQRQVAAVDSDRASRRRRTRSEVEIAGFRCGGLLAGVDRKHCGRCARRTYRPHCEGKYPQPFHAFAPPRRRIRAADLIII